MLPGAYGDIGVVTLGFMRHVMVCVITVFTPQRVSVYTRVGHKDLQCLGSFT